MNRIKFALITLLILLFGSLTFGQSLATTWEVQKYDLSVNLPQNFKTDRNFDITAVLSLKNISDRPFSRLTLRISDQAEIIAASVNNSVADFRKGEENIGGNRKLLRVIVNLPSIQPNTTFTVNLKYKLKVKDNSGLSSLSPAGAQLLPMSFWYPTPNSWFFSGGADYAPFSLKINSSINTPVVSAGIPQGNGFDSKINGQPFFISGNLKKTVSNGVEIYVPAGVERETEKRVEEIGTLVSEAKTFVSQIFGTTVETPLRIVAVDRGAGFSDSGVIFIDDSVFQRQKIDSQTAMTIAEGVTKLWLGSQILIKGGGFGVIKEGLNRHISTEFIESKYGKEVASIERLRQRTNYVTIINRDTPLNISSPLDGYYFTSTANKGASIWRYLIKSLGEKEFFNSIKTLARDGDLDLSEIRDAFPNQKQFLDYALEKVTDMNLLIGLPQKNGNVTKVALRNMGEIPAEVDVVATLSNGQKLTAKAVIPENNFGQATFNTPNNIVRVEVDPDKVYPQTNYEDDIAPRLIDENDALVFIKRDFDRQKFKEAEEKAKIVLNLYPNFDDARILLARSLLAQNKITDARLAFQTAMDEKLPTARSLAWGSFGLGEIALKTGQTSKAGEYFQQTIKADGEYGATLAARNSRKIIGGDQNINAEVSGFFDNFDKSIVANDKSKIDTLILSGEVSRFASNIAGQAQEWKTKVNFADSIDENNILVEADLEIKLLNRNAESGLAVFRLTKVTDGWKISAVEMFEVR